MFTKKMIALAAALAVSQLALADDKLIDSVSIDYGTAAKVRMERLSVAKDWDVKWFQSNGTHLSGYWEASVGFWQQKQYMNISGNDKSLWDIGFTPVFRFQNDTYRLSTLFQFGDHVGVGYVFDNNWEVAAKVQHFSNGGYKKPNTGINYFELKAAYHF